ncbi:MAG: hypothetical protein JXR86_05560 [Spirochaetales bacterium]|nr:hypothetical protein [Spirochaetales bacterium]
MADNWIELMELANSRNEAILREMEELRAYRSATGRTGRHSFVANIILGGLGRAFSSLGDSLQERYHFEGSRNRSNLKKVS